MSSQYFIQSYPLILTDRTVCRLIVWSDQTVVSQLEHVFEPDCRVHQEIAADETKIEIDGTEHYVWAAVGCETLEIHTIEISPDRSGLDALLFLKDVLERCRGLPLARADRGR